MLNLKLAIRRWQLLANAEYPPALTLIAAPGAAIADDEGDDRGHAAMFESSSL